MKVYIKDGAIFFYKYKITGTDSFSRPVTLYAKDDTDRTTQLARVVSGTSLDISPTAAETAKASEWQVLNKTKNFSVADVESYVNGSNPAPFSNIDSGTELRVFSSTDTSKKFTIDYNEAEDSLDFNYN